MLDAACRLILDEVSLPGSAPGGRVEIQEDPHRQLPVQVLPGSVTDFEGDGKWN